MVPNSHADECTVLLDNVTEQRNSDVFHFFTAAKNANVDVLTALLENNANVEKRKTEMMQHRHP